MAEQTRGQRLARRIRVPMGFAVAACFLFFARPSARSLLVSSLLVVPGLWLRAYASGYVRKNTELTATGPYAHTRNPLYLGSVLIAAGFGFGSGSWLLVLVLLVLFAAIYIPTIRGEETYLRSRFPGFDAYAASVPRLLPRLTPARTGQQAGAFSRALYLQHREYNALIGAAAVYAVLGVKAVLSHGR